MWLVSKCRRFRIVVVIMNILLLFLCSFVVLSYWEKLDYAELSVAILLVTNHGIKSSSYVKKSRYCFYSVKKNYLIIEEFKLSFSYARTKKINGFVIEIHCYKS